MFIKYFISYFFMIYWRCRNRICEDKMCIYTNAITATGYKIT